MAVEIHRLSCAAERSDERAVPARTCQWRYRYFIHGRVCQRRCASVFLHCASAKRSVSGRLECYALSCYSAVLRQPVGNVRERRRARVPANTHWTDNWANVQRNCRASAYVIVLPALGQPLCVIENPFGWSANSSSTACTPSLRFNYFFVIYSSIC